ncbi:hypothetical protein VC83_05321 [Pseudogymnoascus destructans]|uniref:Rab-GAP TBC domain-containing protein n=2 Tax=Pseudogymnoascus destructans TaxID=655981 RepID=L8G357_PSED2|nr:uncharacterized protein VC83_05321 [Pseudogymnoascus destructans]ELR06421.1 hypothetical protein GMDG_02137 [Pseudogymnoascus destructans 20631-21]OAF58010.1 hypothetical protein VC83_05321 [Pseudogymnoascus destructans]
MRSLEESRQRWQKTTEGASKVGGLKSLVKADADSICVSGLRSVCWKAFLLFQSVDRNTWAATSEDSRAAYSALKSHFLRLIERPGDLDSTIDPLNDDDNSPWNTLRRDEQLCVEIAQDVERCMPDEPYFRLPETQKTLLQILFIYCKINQDIGYRQGMHELAAPILLAIQRDALAPMTPEESVLSDDGDRLMFNTLDASFIEHDSFTLFNLIMRTAKPFYELGEPDKRLNAGSTSSSQYGSSPIVQRSKQIHEVLLAQVDPELASHLTRIEILPQIFIIRWIRLIFGREFPFEDLLALWDKLFAEDPDLELIDMICVSKLLRIRWQLLDADYSVALTLLLKYPHPTPPCGPQTFVEDAIYLRENLNEPAGAKLINKYTGRAPLSPSSRPVPATPAGRAKPHRAESRFSARKSPLPSPARFLQDQGGVEALLQGAAKGVFDRGERLGINQVVRDAVDEVKRNMQGLSPGPGSPRRTPRNNALSVDEVVTETGKSLADLEVRNKTLALLLNGTIDEIQKASDSTEDASTKSTSVNNAIEKLRFIMLRLEDSSLPLKPDTPRTTADAEDTRAIEPEAKPQSQASHIASPISPQKGIETANSQVEAPPPTAGSFPTLGRTIPRRPRISVSQPSEGLEAGPGKPGQPATGIPTRSTLAQSSFAWMLGPDEHSATSDQSPPMKSPSPFLSSGRKPGSSAARERSAFLFGDDADEDDVNSPASPKRGGSKGDFGLEAMKKTDT